MAERPSPLILTLSLTLSVSICSWLVDAVVDVAADMDASLTWLAGEEMEDSPLDDVTTAAKVESGNGKKRLNKIPNMWQQVVEAQW